ncbi:MAG: class I SAM-dependent methyltransferase [Syntrophaceae bacterium]|jgi:SAM-dependent methyltransferase|nr:class I SAM-dependent methyltransferase [Syntrophaceae bacterium]HOC61276.1 methyltransferase domain-containing protein [Smithellaceae bacterium]HQM46734.1 methyltransferase domain-containing protein [Smithellaceae bacterium]
MITIDFHALHLPPGSTVLDAGCGSGRHLRSLARLPGLKILGIDRNPSDVEGAVKALKEMPDALSLDYSVSCADITKLPFADEYFDCVICSEVLEHIPEHETAVQELVRVLKPKGTLVVSVPRYFSERICWMISPEYSREEGGHIRIYKKRDLKKMLAGHGLRCWKINYKHALHAPYWWLKCLVGTKNEENVFVKLYHRFLVWDMFCKPRGVRFLEEALNPLIGKSIVFYLTKG